MIFCLFWLDQVLCFEYVVFCLLLVGDICVDVCIVGGGYIGLWIVIMFKEYDFGFDVVLVEVDFCGVGVSGCNGGCVLFWLVKFFILEWLFGLIEVICLVKVFEDSIWVIGVFCQCYDVEVDYWLDGIFYIVINLVQVGSIDSVIVVLECYGINFFVKCLLVDVQCLVGLCRYLEGWFLLVVVMV